MSPLLLAALAWGGQPINPHGSAELCGACHTAGPTPAEVGAPMPIVDTCRSCHPTADMHPVGMAPKDVHIPQGWPLEDGKVTCATCHAEPAHQGTTNTTPPFHRGGPYPNVERLCYQCHEISEYTRSDPHHPEPAQGPKDPTCAACHTAPPAKGADPGDANLRWPLDEACTTCHRGQVHAGVAQHVGERMDTPVDLVLGPGDKVTCYTCHDVHGSTPGLAPAGDRAAAFHALALERDWTSLAGLALVWPGGEDAAHPPLLAAPVADGTLCERCHGEGP